MKEGVQGTEFEEDEVTVRRCDGVRVKSKEQEEGKWNLPYAISSHQSEITENPACRFTSLWLAGR
jgi:hypothetical protein